MLSSTGWQGVAWWWWTTEVKLRLNRPLRTWRLPPETPGKLLIVRANPRQPAGLLLSRRPQIRGKCLRDGTLAKGNPSFSARYQIKSIKYQRWLLRFINSLSLRVHGLGKQIYLLFPFGVLYRSLWWNNKISWIRRLWRQSSLLKTKSLFVKT